MIADDIKLFVEAARNQLGSRLLTAEEMLLLLADEICATYTHEETVIRS